MPDKTNNNPTNRTQAINRVRHHEHEQAHDKHTHGHSRPSVYKGYVVRSMRHEAAARTPGRTPAKLTRRPPPPPPASAAGNRGTDEVDNNVFMPISNDDDEWASVHRPMEMPKDENSSRGQHDDGLAAAHFRSKREAALKAKYRHGTAARPQNAEARARSAALAAAAPAHVRPLFTAAKPLSPTPFAPEVLAAALLWAASAAPDLAQRHGGSTALQGMATRSYCKNAQPRSELITWGEVKNWLLDARASALAQANPAAAAVPMSSSLSNAVLPLMLFNAHKPRSEKQLAQALARGELLHTANLMTGRKP